MFGFDKIRNSLQVAFIHKIKGIILHVPFLGMLNGINSEDTAFIAMSNDGDGITVKNELTIHDKTFNTRYFSKGFR